MDFFTTKSLPNGNRGVVDLISGETVSEYKVGNQDSFVQANEVARNYRVELLGDLARADLIVLTRAYPLVTLQNAYQKFLTL